VCCGTRRQVEIDCPADCGFLVTSQAHPPATVRRQQERDVGFLMAMREGLTDRESEFFWVLLTFLAGLKADPLLRLADEDVAEAAGALAATYETATRGVIYEHRPQSLAAQRLLTDGDGVAVVKLAAAGRYYVKFVHMEEVDGADANYESRWATLTFEVR
jgi:hypothetical protein